MERNINETSILLETTESTESIDKIQVALETIVNEFMLYKKGITSGDTFANSVYDVCFWVANSTVKKMHGKGGHENEKAPKRETEKVVNLKTGDTENLFDLGNSTAQSIRILDGVRRDTAYGKSVVNALSGGYEPNVKNTLNIDLVHDIVVTALLECEKLYGLFGENMKFDSMYETKKAVTVFIRKASDLLKVNEPPKEKVMLTNGVKQMFKNASNHVETQAHSKVDLYSPISVEADTDESDTDGHGAIYLQNIAFSDIAGGVHTDGNFGNVYPLENVSATRAKEILLYTENVFRVLELTPERKKIVTWLAYGVTRRKVESIKVPDRAKSNPANERLKLAKEKKVFLSDGERKALQKSAKATRKLTEREIEYIMCGEDFTYLTYDKIAIMLQITETGVSHHVKAIQKKACKAIANGKLPKFEFSERYIEKNEKEEKENQ